MIYLCATRSIAPRLEEMFPGILDNGVKDHGVMKYLLEPNALNESDLLMLRITFNDGHDYFVTEPSEDDIRYIRMLQDQECLERSERTA